MDNTYVMDYLKRTAENIAKIFGNYCETAVYIIDGNRSGIVAIHHPKITNRRIGDSFESTLQTESESIRDEMIHNFYNGIDEQRGNLQVLSGKALKLIVSHYVTEDVHYAMSVIFDNTVFTAAEYALRAFNNASHEDRDIMDQEDQALEEIFETCHQSFGIPIYKMTKKDRIEMVKLLKAKNAFSFQKCVPYIAEKLRVSRYSIYNYLKEIEIEDV